jgi:rare lipoprotein A
MRLPGTRDALLGGFAAAALITAPAQAKAPPTGQNGPQSDFPMTVGQPYQIDGLTFVPSDSMNFDSVGYASVGTEGGGTISAAHHTLPVPSYAEVTDIATGRTILVRIDRRGPMDGSHAIELSPGAAAQLGITAGGKAAVRVRRVNPPEAERALLRAGQPAPERMATPKPLLDVLQRKLNPALAQRTLDSADEDAPSARVKAAEMQAKPVLAAASPPPAMPALAKVEGKATTPMKTAAQSKMATADTPPKGYIPSVPAPVSKAVDEKAKAPARSAAKSPASAADMAKGEVSVPAMKPAKAEAAKKTDAPARQPVSTAEKAAEAGKSAGSFTVQAGAFSDKARAQAVADKVGGTLSQAGKMWRVRVGPYAGHALAEAALAKVKSAGYSDARIQRAE